MVCVQLVGHLGAGANAVWQYSRSIVREKRRLDTTRVADFHACDHMRVCVCGHMDSAEIHQTRGITGRVDYK